MRVTREQMQELIDLHPPVQKQRSTYTGSTRRLDVSGYLSKYGIECVGEKQHGSSTLYLLKACPFDPSHTDKEAAIGQTDDDKLFFQCFHDSCQGRTWKEAREIISGSNPLFLGDSQFVSGSSGSSGSVGFCRFRKAYF